MSKHKVSLTKPHSKLVAKHLPSTNISKTRNVRKTGSIRGDNTPQNGLKDRMAYYGILFRFSQEDSANSKLSIRISKEQSNRYLNHTLFKVSLQLKSLISEVSHEGWKGGRVGVTFDISRSDTALRCMNKQIMRYSPLITKFNLRFVPDLSGRTVVQLCKLLVTLESLREFRTNHLLSVTSFDKLCNSNISHLKRFMVRNQVTRNVKVLVYLVRKGLQKQMLATDAVGVYDSRNPLLLAKLYPNLFVEVLEIGGSFSRKLRSYIVSLKRRN